MTDYRNHFLILLALGSFSLCAWSQEEAVRDLTESELTPELLIEALRPQNAPEAPIRARGIAETLPPRCELFRQQARGLAEPVANTVAVRILFAFGSAALSPAAEENLTALGRALVSPELSPYCFQIEGHTDDVGSESYNLDLSVRRATSVKDYLIARFGVEPERLLVTGYGESQAIASNATEDGRQRNRRVQIVNLGSGGQP